MTATADKLITFYKGQPVPFPDAHGGLAQVDEFARRNVVVIWLDAAGKLRRARIAAAKLAALIEHEPPLIELPANPYRRAIIVRSKTYNLAR